MSLLVFAFHIIVLAILVWSLGMVVANLTCFDSLRAAEPFGPDAPMVSILVPARNEALNIAACAGSLLAQDYPNWELLVLDDHSEDGTGEIALGLGVSESGERAWLIRSAYATAADTVPGACVVSASVKKRNSPRAACAS